MKLRYDQLEAHLARGLAPIYMVSGDEPLQVGEAGDAIRAAARSHGCAEREVLHVEAGFDWSALLASTTTLSLFSERRLVDLRLPTGKPGDAGAKALVQYAQARPEDVLLLVTCPKLDAQQQRSKWFKALEGAGVIVQVWPVEPGRLPAWIGRRMQARGLQPDPAAVSMLAEQVEGNLLAADQEIEKLLLLHGPGPVSADAVADMVADSARFDVFALVDSALAGDAARTARIVYGLRAEGVTPVLVVWALAREVRALAAMAFEVEHGAGPDAAMARQRVWDKRKPLVGKALRRHSAGRWRALLAQCGHADRVVKGAAAGSPWEELLQLAEAMAGIELPGPSP
ncbi:MAG TPA: DNA polymerase III subunit delta [Gammaproteobacteria bacterium]|nr:DNA polymerase III subunit delta [Gammaproteobacteria bacterium]